MIVTTRIDNKIFNINDYEIIDFNKDKLNNFKLIRQCGFYFDCYELKYTIPGYGFNKCPSYCPECQYYIKKTNKRIIKRII